MADESIQSPSCSGPPKEPTTNNVWDQCWPGDTLNQFSQWFWTGSNGNSLIEKLNCYHGDQNNWSGAYDKIRREKDSPSIYCITVNDERLGKEFKFCKVGYTGISTDEGTGNRMEKVMEKIKKENKKDKYKDASVIFRLPIHSVDSSPIRDTEERIRLNVGWKIDPALAERLRLPNRTEWVLTTQKYLNTLRIAIESKKTKGQAVTTNIFKENKDLKFKNFITTQKSLKVTDQDTTGLVLETWIKQKIPWIELRHAQTTSRGKHQAGTTSGGKKQAGTSGGQQQAETSGGKQQAGTTSDGKKQAGTSGGQQQAETSGGKHQAEASGGKQQAETSGGQQQAETSGGKQQAGTTSGGKKQAGTSGGQQQAETSGGKHQAGTTSGGKKQAGTSGGQQQAGTTSDGKQQEVQLKVYLNEPLPELLETMLKMIDKNSV